MPIQSSRPNYSSPDLVRTPSPAGPVPYPNAGHVPFPTDAKVEKIKVHGAPKQSTGDEAGTFKSVASASNLKSHGSTPGIVSFPSAKLKVK